MSAAPIIAGTSSQSKRQSLNAPKMGEAAGPVPIARLVAWGLDLGDPVDELAAFGVDVVADRVDYHFAGGEPSGPHHAGAGQKG